MPGALVEYARFVEVQQRRSRIIAELEAAGYLRKKRVGRVNQYEVALDLPLRQPLHREVAVGDLLQIFQRPHEAS